MKSSVCWSSSSITYLSNSKSTFFIWEHHDSLFHFLTFKQVTPMIIFLPESMTTETTLIFTLWIFHTLKVIYQLFHFILYNLYVTQELAVYIQTFYKFILFWVLNYYVNVFNESSHLIVYKFVFQKISTYYIWWFLVDHCFNIIYFNCIVNYLTLKWFQTSYAFLLLYTQMYMITSTVDSLLTFGKHWHDRIMEDLDP